MRVATIYPHLPAEELAVWVREAPDKGAYKRRLAIWITFIYRYPAWKVADMLCVSESAIWKWVNEYKHKGPEGLNRKGRGGRRWGFMSINEEEKFLKGIREEAIEGKIVTINEIYQQLKKQLKREISKSYVYKLLYRHGWRKIGPRPKHMKKDVKIQEEFKKNSQG